MFFKYFIFFLFFNLLNLYAFDIDDALEKVTKDSKNILSLNKLENDLKTKIDGFEKNIDSKISLYETKAKSLENKAKEFESKIDDKITKSLKEIEGEILVVANLRKETEKIIFYSKIIAAIFCFSFLFIILSIWRFYRKLSNIYKLIENIKNYKEIEERLAKLEVK
ncbi:MAG: hypothetical protein ISQ32_06175 [Rickettsiales bacterium]|nr:hypothetical protein [Rickettsiales bacterium]